MEISSFLGMTAQEMNGCSGLPPKIGWMSCHFCHDGGITNLPNHLPPHSLLILDDSVAPQNVQPNQIRQSIAQLMLQHHCYGLLLDFQRENCKENHAVAEALVLLPFPVAVSEPYAKTLHCPVFLPPVPPDIPIAEYLSPYKGREIWLELAMDTLQLHLTADGCRRVTLDGCPLPLPFSDPSLHCRYRIDCQQGSATFTLHRTREDLFALLEDAKELGVTTTVGLYQELK